MPKAFTKYYKNQFVIWFNCVCVYIYTCIFFNILILLSKWEETILACEGVILWSQLEFI